MYTCLVNTYIKTGHLGRCLNKPPAGVMSLVGIRIRFFRRVQTAIVHACYSVFNNLIFIVRARNVHVMFSRRTFTAVYGFSPISRSIPRGTAAAVRTRDGLPYYGAVTTVVAVAPSAAGPVAMACEPPVSGPGSGPRRSG